MIDREAHLQYRKKPVVIHAIQWLGTNLDEILDFVQAKGSVYRSNNILHVETLEGVMTASPKDWIIRGVKGEYYPCKPDIFEVTYEHL